MSSIINTYDFGKGLPINISFQDDRAWQAIQGLQTQLDRIEKELKTMATALDDKITALQAAVAKETDVEKSAAALIQGFPGLLADAIAKAQAAGATSQQLQAITDVQTAISTSSDALAGAVSANTTPAS